MVGAVHVLSDQPAAPGAGRAFGSCGGGQPFSYMLLYVSAMQEECGHPQQSRRPCLGKEVAYDLGILALLLALFWRVGGRLRYVKSAAQRVGMHLVIGSAAQRVGRHAVIASGLECTWRLQACTYARTYILQPFFEYYAITGFFY